MRTKMAKEMLYFAVHQSKIITFVRNTAAVEHEDVKWLEAEILATLTRMEKQILKMVVAISKQHPGITIGDDEEKVDRKIGKMLTGLGNKLKYTEFDENARYIDVDIAKKGLPKSLRTFLTASIVCTDIFREKHSSQMDGDAKKEFESYRERTVTARNSLVKYDIIAYNK